MQSAGSHVALVRWLEAIHAAIWRAVISHANDLDTSSAPAWRACRTQVPLTSSLARIISAKDSVVARRSA